MIFVDMVIEVIGTKRIRTVFETGDSLQVFGDWHAVVEFYDRYEKEIWEYLGVCSEQAGVETLKYIVDNIPYPMFISGLKDFKRALVEIVLVNICDDYLGKLDK